MGYLISGLFLVIGIALELVGYWMWDSTPFCSSLSLLVICGRYWLVLLTSIPIGAGFLVVGGVLLRRARDPFM